MRNLEALLGRERRDILRVAEAAGAFYSPFDVLTKSGKWRHIDNPASELKGIQKRIERRILANVTFPSKMFGGIRGRSASQHARCHVRQSIVVKLDLKDCFPNIHDTDVYDALRVQLPASATIAGILTKLTTFQRRLPQGAPTSSLLCNMVLLPLYHDLQFIATRYGLVLSMFVDDIAVSGELAREALGDLLAAIRGHGHAISSKKTILMPGHARQALVGAVVNAKLSAGHVRVRAVRTEILSVAHAEHRPSEQTIAKLDGKISHVESLSSDQAASLRRITHLLARDECSDGTHVPPGMVRRRCSSFAAHR
jgi:hypothetical protein